MLRALEPNGCSAAGTGPLHARHLKWVCASAVGLQAVVRLFCSGILGRRSMPCHHRVLSGVEHYAGFCPQPGQPQGATNRHSFCHISIVRNLILPVGIRIWPVLWAYLHKSQTMRTLGSWSKSLTNALKTGDHSHAVANSARSQKKPKHRQIEIRPAK